MRRAARPTWAAVQACCLGAELPLERIRALPAAEGVARRDPVRGLGPADSAAPARQRAAPVLGKVALGALQRGAALVQRQAPAVTCVRRTSSANVMAWALLTNGRKSHHQAW
jgi:hypothetical protein